MYQVFDSTGHGDPEYLSNGIQDAVDNGARVINYSGSGPDYSALEESAIQYALNHNPSVLIICAAGNTDLGSVRYPAALAPLYNNLIAVSATDNNDNIASFSAIGSQVTISAPGSQIYSTTPNYSSFYLYDNYPYLSTNYDYYDGTSFSTPYVTGVASLMYSVNPNLSAAQVKDILIKTSLDKGNYGKDDYFGYGRLNAYRAVKATQILTTYPNATFITSSKSSTATLDSDWYTLVINTQTYSARRYKMEVTFNLNNYFGAPSNALIWYNSNGWSNSNPLYNPPPWYQIVSQNGSDVTVKTYTYELINLAGDHLWTVPLSELKIDILGYGIPILPLSAIISGPSIAPCATGTWYANVSGGYPPYSYQWYHMYTSDLVQLNKSQGGITPNKQINTWYPVGTNSSMLNFYLCGGNSYLRVDVTDSHNSTVSTQYYVASSSGDGGAVLPKSESNSNSFITPLNYSLDQNYPNPFNPTTQIKYAIKEAGFVTLKVYDLLGKVVATLVNENKPAGFYTLNFDATRLSSGIYLYTLKTNDFYTTKKMIILK